MDETEKVTINMSAVYPGKMSTQIHTTRQLERCLPRG